MLLKGALVKDFQLPITTFDDIDRNIKEEIEQKE